MERATIQTIAELAGVSKTTVSRVLNAKPDVSPATKARIEEAIRQVSYIPSRTALSLATGRSQLIGMSFPTMRRSFFHMLVEGVDEVQREYDLDIVLYATSQAERRGKLLQRAVDSGLLAGLICTLPGSESAFLEARFRSGFPTVVLLGCRGEDLQLPRIGVDNREGAAVAVRHLLERGHRRIAALLGSQQFQVMAARFAGYRDALQEAGIGIDPALVKAGDALDLEVTGYRSTRDLLSSADPPSAVFAAADDLALGALRAAAEMGIAVPAQLAVVGFDDIPEAATYRPSLTTIRQPTADLAKTAVRLLLEQMANGTAGASGATLPTELVVRESSGGAVDIGPVGLPCSAVSPPQHL